MSVIHNGISRTGDAQSITLATHASNVDNAYKGMTITLTDGSCATQTQVIASYRGASRVATVYTPWAMNEFANSEDLSNSSWANESNIIVSTDVVANPDGQMRADLVIPTTTVGNHTISVTSATSLKPNTNYVMLARGKPSGYPFLGMQAKRFDGNFLVAIFNVSTGQFGTTYANTTQSTRNIRPLANGWVECELQFNSLSGIAPGVVPFFFLVSSDANTTWGGDNTSGVFFGGVQLRKANTSPGYIFTPGGPEITPDSSTAYSITARDGFIPPLSSSNAYHQLSDGSNQGTILGRSTVDPIGFYGATPVKQQSGATSVVPITASTLTLSSVQTGSTAGQGFSSAALFNAVLSTVVLLQADVTALSAGLNALHIAASSTGLTAGS